MQRECQLCKLHKKLINAHIIPKWAFKYLHHENSTKQSIVIFSKDKMVRRPIGPYDQNILCHECDSFLGTYDEYGKDILLGAPLEYYNDAAYIIKNVNFNKIQIFLLSVIWRASISEKDEFNRVQIGPYEERIRTILLNAKEKTEGEFLEKYSFVITKFRKGMLPSDVVYKNIQIPHIQKIEGINVAVLYMPKGIKIYLKLDQRDFTGLIRKIIDHREEGLIVPCTKSYAESDEFKSMMEAISSNDIIK